MIGPCPERHLVFTSIYLAHTNFNSSFLFLLYGMPLGQYPNTPIPRSELNNVINSLSPN